MKKIDLTGKIFGKLTVIKEDPKRNKRGQIKWFCECECGHISSKVGSKLKSGDVKSCGVPNNHNWQKGDYANEYSIWKDLRKRCNNPNHKSYKNYGNRGIKVHERWDIFDNFLKDMGKRPSKKHSIERVDNNKGYSPDNCIWADDTTQAINRRISSLNTSGYKGVGLRKNGKWAVRIKIHGKRTQIGTYENKKDAIQARKEAEIKYFGAPNQ